MIKLFIITLYISLFFKTSAQKEDRCTQVLNVLNNVTNACQAFPPQDYCNIFVGEAIQEIYGISDFVLANSPTGYYQANAIADLLVTNLSDKWDNIGTCDNQDALKTAQDDANSNRCVIAIWKNNSSDTAHGHITLLLPGNLLNSTSWNMMVPNCANFSLGSDKNNCVCDKLSRAFGKDKLQSVLLYVHKDGS